MGVPFLMMFGLLGILCVLLVKFIMVPLALLALWACKLMALSASHALWAPLVCLALYFVHFAIQAHLRTPVGQLHVKHVRLGITPLLVHLRVLLAVQALTATAQGVKSVAFVHLALTLMQ
jgi:hypothetical protein